MEAYAVIETGGKQYRVQQGDVLDIELLTADEGASLEFDALAVSNGAELSISASARRTLRRRRRSFCRARRSDTCADSTCRVRDPAGSAGGGGTAPAGAAGMG